MVHSQSEEKLEFKLDPDNELRFEVPGNHSTDKKKKTYVELKSGNAEIFGSEMTVGKKYIFSPGSRIPIYSWQGGNIEINGPVSYSPVISRETPMIMYLNTHAALEQLRRKADTDQSRGPVVMIVGPTDVGKSSVTKMLLNYAVRVGRRPVYVDLDVGQGGLSCPGTIGGMLVERPAMIEEGFPQVAPLVFHYGHTSPTYNLPLYNQLVSKLANVINSRLEQNKKACASGVIINTCGTTNDKTAYASDTYKIITHTALEFEVDVIIVLDGESLYNDLIKDMPSFVKVVFQPKSGGIVERNYSVRNEARIRRVKDYFYGVKNNFHPHTFQVNFSDVKIYKIRESKSTKSAFRSKLSRIYPDKDKDIDLSNHLLGVCFNTGTDDEVMGSNIAGFICVKKVDIENSLLTVLSPQPAPLPKTTLIYSEMTFADFMDSK